MRGSHSAIQPDEETTSFSTTRHFYSNLYFQDCDLGCLLTIFLLELLSCAMQWLVFLSGSHSLHVDGDFSTYTARSIAEARPCMEFGRWRVEILSTSVSLKWIKITLIIVCLINIHNILLSTDNIFISPKNCIFLNAKVVFQKWEYNLKGSTYFTCLMK